jgi:hypothetical protein
MKERSSKIFLVGHIGFVLDLDEETMLCWMGEFESQL